MNNEPNQLDVADLTSGTTSDPPRGSTGCLGALLMILFVLSLPAACATEGASLLYFSGPLLLLWFGVRQAGQQANVDKANWRAARASAALPLIAELQRQILQRFDCRPCPRCAELKMLVLRMTPNGRSFEVQCEHCRHSFRWKAVHPDTGDVSTAYVVAVDALSGTNCVPDVSVPPTKFSAEGGRELIPEGVRRVVWRRDGGRCVQCGTDVNLHFDHVIPVSRGGATTIENLQILCGPCNLSKGASV